MNNEFHWHSEEKNIVHDLEADIIIELVDKPAKGKLIDIGCGFGDISKRLSLKTKYDILATDVSKNALEKAKKVLKGTKVKVQKQDVFNIKYPDNTFDVAISTGYTCAASIPGAMEEVARIVKPGGEILIDLRRVYSFWSLPTMLRHYGNYKKGKDITFGILGVKKYFEKYGLKLEEAKSFYTYPPILKSNTGRAYFEKTFGKVLKIFLARVIVVKFRKIK